jgi:hypothetical protein
MPRRRRPAGLECLVELARKAAILEREMSVQRDAIERLRETAARPIEKRLPPSRLRADAQP